MVGRLVGMKVAGLVAQSAAMVATKAVQSVAGLGSKLVVHCEKKKKRRNK